MPNWQNIKAWLKTLFNSGNGHECEAIVIVRKKRPSLLACAICGEEM